MKNAEIAKILFAIAELLEMQGVQFKPRAYEKAARAVESLTEEASDIYKKGGTKALKEIPGIGENISRKMEEMITTGKLRYYEKLKKEFPLDVEGLMDVPGLGPKRIMILHKELGVKDLKELAAAAKKGEIRKLEGFGTTAEKNILKGIGIVERGKRRFVLGHIEQLAEEIKERLGKLKSVNKVEISGSYRRRKETVGDLDYLVIASSPQVVMDFFTSMPEVKDVIAKGKTKSSVRLRNDMNVDLRVLGEKEFGSALQYFTGSKEHNVVLRRIANSKGLTLSEYGLFRIKGKRWVAGRTEKEIYSKLGLGYIEPELRENKGEIEAAQKKLPKLVRLEDVKGDTQTQSDWSDGNCSIQELAETAASLGHTFMVVTDHGGSALKVANALSPARLKKQAKEIEEVEERVGIRIFKGTEVDILKDGKLALPRKALEELDFVLAAVHSGFKMGEKEMTKRITSAIEDYPVHAFAHPTGRVINRREPYAVDLEELFDVCKGTGTRLEIDGFPDRLDLKDVHIRAAKENGCRFTVSSDAHDRHHIRYLKYAVDQARRGWLEAKDILNTHPVKRIEKELEKRG